jgi:hypothetical protein
MIRAFITLLALLAASPAYGQEPLMVMPEVEVKPAPEAVVVPETVVEAPAQVNVASVPVADAPVPEMMSPAPAVALPSADGPLNPVDVGGLVTMLITAIKAKNWPLVAGLLIFGVVFSLRAFGGRLHPWFDSRRGAVILTVATAAVGAVVAPLIAGVEWSAELLGQAVTAALAAMGVVAGYRALKKGGTSEKHIEKRVTRLAAKDAEKATKPTKD